MALAPNRPTESQPPRAVFIRLDSANFCCISTACGSKTSPGEPPGLWGGRSRFGIRVGCSPWLFLRAAGCAVLFFFGGRVGRKRGWDGEKKEQPWAGFWKLKGLGDGSCSGAGSSSLRCEEGSALQKVLCFPGANESQGVVLQLWLDWDLQIARNRPSRKDQVLDPFGRMRLRKVTQGLLQLEELFFGVTRLGLPQRGRWMSLKIATTT